jgi:hypothetical protein
MENRPRTSLRRLLRECHSGDEESQGRAYSRSDCGFERSRRSNRFLNESLTTNQSGASTIVPHSTGLLGSLTPRCHVLRALRQASRLSIARMSFKLRNGVSNGEACFHRR